MALGRGILLMATGLFMVGCGFGELPKSKAQAEMALQGALTEYRIRADLVPSVIKLVQSQKDSRLHALAQELSQNHSRVVALDKPAAEMNQQDLNRFQSFQVGLSVTLGRFLSVVEQDKKMASLPDVVGFRNQLHNIEGRIAKARQEYMRQGPAFNQSLSSPPVKWVNSYYYKFQPLPLFENTAEVDNP